MGQAAIRFDNVSFQPTDSARVQNLNFAIASGDVFVLLGRSGCGKTTTLKLINRLLLPTSGTVEVLGNSTQQWNPIQLRRQIGYVIQEIGLLPHFTVAKNVGLVPSLLGWSTGQRQSRTYELLELVGLNPSHFAQRYPDQLSGGQRQRVAVARALAADPPILLMDEPFAALDPVTRIELQQEFMQLQQQLHKTVVWVTHDVQEALRLGSHIALMQTGEILSIDPPAAFLNSTHPEAQSFLQGFRLAVDLQHSLGQP